MSPDTTAEGLAFRSKLSRRAYTSVKSRTPAHQHIMKAALAPQGGKDHSWSTTADDDDASQRKSKKSIKHAKVKLSDDLDANQHPRAPPWARAAAADAAWPEFILPHLWDPELGPLYPFDEMYAQEEERSAYRAAQKAIKPEPLPPEMVLDTFAFHVPLPSILTSRIEDLRNEKERQQLAKELAIERERLRAKEAELLSLKRREMAASHAAGEMPKEYTVGGMQTEADPSLTSGTVIYASKWSTSGPPMDPSSSSKSRKGGAKGDSTKKSAPSSKKKKKKRAAHANANNHHHRDNYVPSRQPRSTPQTPAQATIVPSMHDMPSLGLVSDDNIFSTASFHPQLGYTNLTPFFVGQDEWLCSWCEMALLFGDDDAKTQQLIKKRKNALKVRKKAQRRAAKAAAGELPAKDSKKKKGKASTNTSTTNSAPAQGPARKCASVQTVPEGEDPHAPPPTPETSDSPPLTHEDDEGDEEDDIDSDQAEVGTSDDEEDVDAETSSR